MATEGRRGLGWGWEGAPRAAPLSQRGPFPPPPQLAWPSPTLNLQKGKLRPREGRRRPRSRTLAGGVESDDTRTPCFPAQVQDRDDSGGEGWADLHLLSTHCLSPGSSPGGRAGLGPVTLTPAAGSPGRGAPVGNLPGRKRRRPLPLHAASGQRTGRAGLSEGNAPKVAWERSGSARGLN